MTDTTSETSPGIFAADSAAHVAAKSQIDNIMTLDEMLDAATLVEREEKICLRGDLVRRLEAVIEELSTLVDTEGNLLNDSADAALSDSSRVDELQEEADRLREQMSKFMLVVLFRALDSDEWEEFDGAHRTGSDKHLKNRRAYEHELIAKCAVRPSMTAADVEKKIRKKVSQGQFVKLFNAAYFVNNADGVEVPKLPSFLHSQRLQEPALS